MRSLFLFVAGAVAVSAQPSNWDLPSSGATLTLDYERPLLDRGADFGIITSAWSLGVAYPVTPAVRLVGELPFAFASADLDGGYVNGAALGNIQIGAEVDGATAPVNVGAYLRVPTASESGDLGGDAQGIGLLADYEQFGAFQEEVATFAVKVEGLPTASDGLSFRLRAVPQLLFATGGGGSDAELFVGYAARAIFDTGRARIAGGFSGISIVTEDPDERHEVSIGVVADTELSRSFRLGATGRVPVIGNVDEVVNGVIGVRLVYGGL